MRTQFDVGQEVYVRAIVEGIEVDSHGIEYKVCIPYQNPIYSPKLTLREDSLTSCEVADFIRQEGEKC